MTIREKQNRFVSLLVNIILFSAMLAAADGCKPAGSLPSQTYSDIQYGADKENTFDVSLPEGRTVKTPVIILVHGGAWTGGDKSDFSFLRGYFTDRGFAAFSINYRLARTKGTGIKNILDDMDQVIACVKEKGREWTFSNDVVFLLGHSAGGHIALLYSFSRAREGAIRGVVSYCGLSDLTAKDLEMFLSRMDKNDAQLSKKSFDRVGFVTGPERKMRIAASPIFVTRDIPVLLVCGKMDDIIPWSQSENLHKKMKERGFDSTLLVYPDMGHDITPHYGDIMKITRKWIGERM